ncbi:ATP-binding cassette domain-containing protein [Bifidobacterium gallicum]|uniref:Putative ABC transporter, ATP-binding protein n=1 Tax=Bifidobacterium gallicum DSM 20093 = LMG 11596 TaxID=561180 RepID=D1NU09_9BIFI|nr:ATP-binding cassette domain-containing protein [Bifidobacterium gallicum]EFA23213.1 hypothetical protein BIFGAL_03330 [Bifidobacterium gallicum DSM 20093 = LMG 11596]KFI58875.1 putative ABC transporter, ATP-binding protein [Bifidobacterium gallicum DSM 20093 = LMG 11596]
MAERKKLQVACALSLEPSVLIADEPTNHLDAPTRQELIDALQRFTGIGIVITHDVAVVNQLASRSYLLRQVHTDAGNCTVVEAYEGTWEIIEEQIKERNTTAQRQHSRAKAETKRLQAERVRRMEKTRAVAAASQRTPDRRDHDACKRKKFAKGGLDAGVSRNVARLEGRIAAAQRAQEGFVTATKRYDGAVRFDIVPSSRRELMHLEQGVIRLTSQEPLWDQADPDELPRYVARVDGNHVNLTRNRELTGHTLQHTSEALAIPRISVGHGTIS